MRILMFFHGGSNNRGCEAIVRTAASLIRNHIPDAYIGLSSTQPETDKVVAHLLDKIHDGSDTTFSNNHFSWWMAAIRNKLFKDESYAFRLIHKKIIDLIPQYDVFLSIGGDNYCYGEQPGIYEIDRQIKKAGKKLILWGASIGEEDLSEEKIKDLQRFDLILARETLTKEILEKAGLTNVKLCADGAFTMEAEFLPQPEGWKENQMVGFNYSPLVFQKNPASKEATFALIEHILATTPFSIVLTPHVIQSHNNDFETLKEFYEHFKTTGRVILLPDNLTAPQYKGYIARMRFFIGARTHATIAAYSSGVPTLVLGYSVKSKGIAKDIFGEVKWVLSIDVQSNKEMLIKSFDNLMQNEAIAKDALNRAIPKLRAMAFETIRYLKN